MNQASLVDTPMFYYGLGIDCFKVIGHTSTLFIITSKEAPSAHSPLLYFDLHFKVDFSFMKSKYLEILVT